MLNIHYIWIVLDIITLTVAYWDAITKVTILTFMDQYFYTSFILPSTISLNKYIMSLIRYL